MRINLMAIATLIAISLAGCSDDDSNSNGDMLNGTVIPNSETQPSDTNATNDTPTNPLDGIGTVEQVGSGFQFVEGPVYRQNDNSLIFSDVPTDTIFLLLDDGSVEPLLQNQTANGLALDTQNRLVIAANSGRTLSRLEGSGSVTVLADRFEGALFNSPNDVAVHSNGDVYFTDPPFAISEAMSEVGCAGVYRLSADGNLSQFWCNGIDTRPNGIVLSPNQDRVYTSFFSSGEILSWPLAADGSVGEVETFATTAVFADGMTVDAQGNVFITSSAGVEVFAPDGTRWGTIEVPQRPSNCTIGGPDNKTLYITAQSGLYTVQL